MKVELNKGRYILAVSGGVDSMVLLDILSRQKDIEIVVAHFDHGIRPGSAKDAHFVRRAAESRGLKFELGKGRLGQNASEEIARTARYGYFESLQKKYDAKAIVTAHHQDDLIETAFINILRGTGPRGLTAMMQNKNVLRPLLNFTKDQILQYAHEHSLRWREDESNQDIRYLRNYIRHHVMPKIDIKQRKNVVNEILDAKITQEEIDSLIEILEKDIFLDGDTIDRIAFASLSFPIATEVMIKWLKKQGVKDLTKQNIESLAMAVKTALPNSRRNIKQNQWLIFDDKKVRFYTNTFQTG